MQSLPFTQVHDYAFFELFDYYLLMYTGKSLPVVERFFFIYTNIY